MLVTPLHRLIKLRKDRRGGREKDEGRGWRERRGKKREGGKRSKKDRRIALGLLKIMILPVSQSSDGWKMIPAHFFYSTNR